MRIYRDPLPDCHPRRRSVRCSPFLRRKLRNHLTANFGAGTDVRLTSIDCLAYFKASFLPAASRAIDSRMRFSRVSGRLAK